MTKVSKVKKKKKATKRKATPSVEQKWVELKESANSEVQDYNVNGNFSVNTSIQHPKFGVGVVTEAFHNKIEVHFQEGSKSLVQNRGQI
ncbi:MAG: hypothetical protein H6625_03570 [Bdellovibrionaceae bacterium]|nr:hypothetical protein [Pseudobdellovibrionaceae bacterium]